VCTRWRRISVERPLYCVGCSRVPLFHCPCVFENCRKAEGGRAGEKNTPAFSGNTKGERLLGREVSDGNNRNCFSVSFQEFGFIHSGAPALPLSRSVERFVTATRYIALGILSLHVNSSPSRDESTLTACIPSHTLK
jgi:hypothetical protein